MIGAGEIARRYARAVFGLGENPSGRAKLAGEVATLAQEIGGSDALRRVLFTPLHPRAERKGVVHELTEKLGLSREVRAVAEILVEENRTQILPALADEMRRLVDLEAGRVEARVTSARPLDAAAQDALKSALSRRVGSDVVLALDVDPTLIGGVIARVGDLLFDGSIRTQLENLGANLKKGPAT